MEGLTAREELFCQSFVNDIKRNQTNAAIAAGYSEKTARTTAWRMMKNVDIQKRIRELEREALSEAGFTPEMIRAFAIRQLVAIAGTDMADIAEVVYEDDARRSAALAQRAEAQGGQLPIDLGGAMVYVKPTSEWTADERAYVKKIGMGKEGVQIEPQDKLAALRLLADIAGITKQGLELSGSVSVADEVAAARARVETMGGLPSVSDMADE